MNPLPGNVTVALDVPAKRLLMIAFHFPPLAGSSGIQRTLRFVQHLPAFGWQAFVLTIDPRAYERVSGDLNAAVPPHTIVRRAFGLDAARHLAIGGRYIAAMARPDRWASWRWDGVRQGIRLIRQYRPHAIWSTYPIATAHAIGAALHRRTGVPWVADFRDPMAQDGYPEDPLTWQQYRRIEEHAFQSAAATVFTTPSAADEYRARYPAASAKIHVIENGYDEEAFVEATPSDQSRLLVPGALTLLHSGIVYPNERDPTQLMAALRLLHDAGTIAPGKFFIRFRAAVSDDLVRNLAAQQGVQAYVELCPALPYREALAEMMLADGLLVLQASNCNAQIPAKLYEYLRAGRPVLGLTDLAGDTAGVLRAAGIDCIARLDDAADIAGLIARFVSRDASAALHMRASQEYVRLASRRARTEQLSRLLDGLVTADRRG